MNLNIIGNGFDLYHGLPSSYYYFGCYLIKKDAKFYEEIGKMYNLNWCKPLGPSIVHDYEYIVEDIFWREFEKHLGEVDESFIVDTHNYDLCLENSDPIDIEMNDYEIAEKLKRYFAHWVIDTLDKKENYEIIEREMQRAVERLVFNNEDYFVIFNYTHTLQELYKISENKIHYVHGECFGEEDSDELIVGHGNNQRINELRGYIDKLEQSYNFTQEINNTINEYQCLLRYIENLKKDVQWCSVACNQFYQRINGNLDSINIYGLSLGDVDIPYLQQIRHNWPNTKWRFSYYSEKDQRKIDDVATVLNLNNSEYETFYFANSLANNIREEIIYTQDINIY